MRIVFFNHDGQRIGWETPPNPSEASPREILYRTLLKRLERTQSLNSIWKICGAQIRYDDAIPHYTYERDALSIDVLSVSQAARDILPDVDLHRFEVNFSDLTHSFWMHDDQVHSGLTLEITAILNHMHRAGYAFEANGAHTAITLDCNGDSIVMAASDLLSRIYLVYPPGNNNVEVASYDPPESFYYDEADEWTGSAEELPEVNMPSVPDFASNDRRFGLEFEFPVPRTNSDPYNWVGKNLRAVVDNVEVTDYQHSDGSYWNLKPDSSCGMELASPALTWEDWDDVEAVLMALNAMNIRVNVNCGLHVHHDLSDLTVVQLRRLVVLWVTFEEILFNLVDETRKHNRYCIPYKNSLQHQTWKTLVDPMRDVVELQDFLVNMIGRYRSLNCSGWWQHGRVEMRLHEGTLDPNVTKFWVFLTQRMVDIAQNYLDYKALETAYDTRGLDGLEQLFKQMIGSNLPEEHRTAFDNLWNIRYKKPISHWSASV